MIKKFYFFITLVTSLFILGASCITIKEMPLNSLQTTNQKNEISEQSSLQENKKIIETAPIKQEIIKCSTIDCLIEFAKTCTKSELVHAYSMPFPFMPDSGITINSKTYYKINGNSTNNICTFTHKSLGGTMTLSKEGKQKALQGGQTEKEINEQIKTMSDSLNDPTTLQYTTTCNGTNTDITKYLTNTKQGNFSGSCAFALGEKETKCTVEPNLTCITKLN